VRTFARHLDLHAVALPAEELAGDADHVAGVLARVVVLRVEACGLRHGEEKLAPEFAPNVPRYLSRCRFFYYQQKKKKKKKPQKKKKYQ